MPMEERTLLIPVDEGLDSYSNAHRLKPGPVTNATNVALDRDGYLYPGVGQANSPAAATQTVFQQAEVCESLGALSGGAGFDTDCVVAHARVAPALVTTSSKEFVASGASKLARTAKPVPMGGQSTQIIAGNLGLRVAGSADSSMRRPTVAMSGGTTRCYAWIDFLGRLFICREDAVTGQCETPLYRTTPQFASSGTAITSHSRVQIAATNLGFIIATIRGTTVELLTFGRQIGQEESYSTQTLTLTGTPVNLDIVSAPQFVGVTPNPTDAVVVTYVAVTTAAGSLTMYSGQNSFAANTSFGHTVIANSPVTLAVQQVPSAVGGVGSGVVATYSAAGTVQFSTFGYNPVGSPFVSRVLRPMSTFTGTPRQISVGFDGDAVANDTPLYVAAESGQSAIVNNGVSHAMNLVAVQSRTTASATGTNLPVYVHGGLAIAGRIAPLPTASGWAVNVRSGWYGSLAAAAHPNGYLLGVDGVFLGRYGDADWDLPEDFTGGSYTSAGIQNYSNGVWHTATNVHPVSGKVYAEALVYAWPQLTYVELLGLQNGYVTTGNTSCARVSFTAMDGRTPVQFGPVVSVPAMHTINYDGANATEAGFWTAAPSPDLASGGSAPSWGAFTYYYLVVMEYTDGTGRVHRSAPSYPVAIAKPAATGVTVSVPFHFPTLKGFETNGVRLGVYRTLADVNAIAAEGVDWYLVDKGPVNIPEVGTITQAALFSSALAVFDTLVDADLKRRPRLYTYGMTVSAASGTDAPPPFQSLTTWNNRLWGVANRNGPELWVTWPLDNAVIRPEGPTWSSANRIALPAEIGQPLALHGLDDKLIIFGSRTDYVLNGDGPQRNETLIDVPGSFSSPIALPTPGGLRAPNAVVRVPQGLIIQGTQGFMLLDRSLTYQPIGRSIQNFTDSNIFEPGLLYPDRDVVIFPSPDGVFALGYYYNSQRWTRFTGDFRSGVVCRDKGNQVVTLAPSTITGKLLRQVTESTPTFDFTTPWIEMRLPASGGGEVPNVAAYGQLRELQVQGECGSGTVTLTLTTYIDTEASTSTPPFSQTITQGPAGAATLDGQWRFGLKDTHCRRVKFKLSVTASTDSTPPIKLSGLVLNFVVESGVSRLGGNYSSYAGA